MNAKEAIGFLEIRKHPFYNLEKEKLDEIIALLERGEKYEAMWKELKIEYTNQWDISHIPVSMKEIKQKYFPEK